jgi:hypothetical protein
VLPESVNFYTTLVITVSAERAEPLARWSTKNYVSLRVFRTILDVSRKYRASKISFEGCRGSNVMFDGKNRFKAKITVVESET